MTKNKNIFWIFYTFIIILSILTANFDIVLDPYKEGILIIVFGSISLIIIHLFFYKIYYSLIYQKKLNDISPGLLYSSVFGGITSIILTTIIKFYSINVDYDIPKYNSIITFFFFSLVFVYLACIIICWWVDSLKYGISNVSSLKFLFASFIFYFINFVMSWAIFFFSLTLFGGIS